MRVKEVERPTPREVYDWACQLTAEQRAWTSVEDYYWVYAAKRLLWKLKGEPKGALIGVNGLQGSGKSSMAAAVTIKLARETEQECYHIKWRSGKPLTESLNTDDDFQSRVMNDILDVERELMEDYKTAPLQPVKKPKWLSKKERAELKERTELEALYSCHTLFIDMPDYSRTSRRFMDKDLDGIQVLWDDLKRKRSKANVVVFIQKELRCRHFIFDKMDPIDLKPMTSEEMVEAYMQKWKALYPFKEDSLLLLSKFSRGIFRRFLKYIQLSIENWAPKYERGKAPKFINKEWVRKAVTASRLLIDRQLELTDRLTPSKFSNAKAILNTIEERERAQTEIAEMTGLSEATVSRMTKTLKLYDFITVRAGKGRERLLKVKV